MRRSVTIWVILLIMVVLAAVAGAAPDHNPKITEDTFLVLTTGDVGPPRIDFVSRGGNARIKLFRMDGTDTVRTWPVGAEWITIYDLLNGDFPRSLSECKKANRCSVVIIDPGAELTATW